MRNLVLFTALLASTASTASAASLNDLKPARLEGRKLRVTTTVNMVSDLARNVGGNRVEVTELMGPGVDPHLFKASAGDVRKLAGADLVLYAGLNLEGKMVELLSRSDRAFAVTDTIPRARLIRPEGGFEGTYTYDPHVWFDVSLWKHTVTATRDALSRVDPAGRATYANNAAAYLKKLDRLDAQVKSMIGRIPKNQRVLITAHDAFGYFGRRYGLEVRGVQGLSTTSEAGARDVSDLASFVAKRRIPAIFVESSVPRRTVDAVVAAARARGWKLQLGGELFSDAAGKPGTLEGTYIGMVEHNARTISEALRGQQARQER
ncbi:manganese/zinc/iron transport system substrate-binding protein [Deinobacterium chartae]|uniref:Manganese/zinc/iron transport system substrate-binding protein n=1 Tax=Deinobacterium chartae TaxID=521158 RepID=A0A841HTX6_9DEIO|nr:zinc ABC transporter substrate-binding protein [Deinobacterium chartae]MBB6096881.1 manganese/zinc/iron transport system substrate-binding protein [Deinobacterium chartae]